MSRYRKVEVATWTDERFRELTPAPPNGQTLWLYLLTGQRTTALPGLVIANELVMASDLGWSVEAFREAFGEVFAKGMAEASWKGGLVVLTKALLDSTGEPRETAKPQSPNVIRSWAKAWDEVPDCDLKNKYLLRLESFSKALGKAFAEAFAEAFRKALAKASRHPSPIQEQDTGTGTGTGSGEGAALPPLVNPDTKRKGRTKKPREEADSGTDHARVRACWLAYWKRRTGLAPEWGGRHGKRLNEILAAHGAPEVERRIALLEASGVRFHQGWDFLQFSSMSDQLVAAAAASDGYDVRYGRARLPSPEEYEQEDDPFGERKPVVAP